MTRLQKIQPWLTKHPALAEGISIAGFFFYCLELWRYTHIQISVLDEGLYLLKGWLYATGEYRPFQDYGLWTNQMPLAFLIPGWVERIFGRGLETGRTFALILGLLTLLALWLVARRLSNRWVAAGLVVAVALNPAAARMVSMVASQGLVACLLAWTMFFCLGEKRKNWQLALAGLLAGSAVMVRINLVPMLALLFLYILWAHGWRPALWLLAGEVLVFGGIHAAYWPNDLRLWSRWLPIHLPFLDPWAPPPNIQTWDPDNPAGFRVASLFLVFRFHFMAMAGIIISWIFWPKEWKNSLQRKTAIFLSVLLIVFFMVHAWAALGNEYCVFCFPTYTTFYSGLGLLLVAITVPAWRLDLPTWRKWAGALMMLALLLGMAYSSEGAAESLLGKDFYKNLLALPVPGFSSGALLWQILVNKLKVEYASIYDAVHVSFPMIVAGCFGLLLLSAGALTGSRKNSVATGLIIFTLLGMLLSPSQLLAGEYNSYDCSQDVIPTYKAVGAELAKVIPSGSTVYWVGYSPVTLLALPGIKIFPAQLNGVYSFRISDDDDALVKYGWWNQHLAEKWIKQTDFVLVETRNMPHDGWLIQTLESSAFVKVAETSATNCQSDSSFNVFRRK